MSYTVFARKYRPRKFGEVLGQEHITRTLRNAIDRKRIAHAYIFVGPRGTGKTSTARIFAMALNCTDGPRADYDPADPRCVEIAQGRSLDVIEIDGASNNGVEQVRELRESIKFAPSGSGYKIYIIDEVHMLSPAAFNALLKTLEEPPAHAIFLLATTDVQKVLPTILSRCQRFDLRRIPAATIAKHLLWIAGEESLSLDRAAADAVARGAEGGLRDAESMLDQLVAFCGKSITEADVLKVFGFTSLQATSGLCDAILDADASAALRAVHGHAEEGKDLGRMMSDLISHLRNLLVLKANPAGLDDELMPEAVALLTAQAARAPMDKLLDLIEQFAAAEDRMKWASNKKMHFEVAVIRAIQVLNTATLTEVLDTLTHLRGGELPAPKAAAPRPPAPKAAPEKAAPGKAVPEQIVREKAAPERAAAPPAVPVAAQPPPPAPAAPPQPGAVSPIAQAAAAPAPPAKAAGDFWPAFVEQVRVNRKLIACWVEAGAFLGVEADTVQLGFPPSESIAKEHLEASHLPFLEDVAAGILGRRARLQLVVREGVMPSPLPPPPPPRDPMEEFKDDPLIKRALEIFHAEIKAAT